MELPKNRNPLWLGLMAALLAFAVYLPMLRAEFTWDDRIVQREQIPYFNSLSDAFRPPHGLAQWVGAYYRPVVSLSYMFDARANRVVYGEATQRDVLATKYARIPHATNLLLHALTAFLVTLLAYRLRRGAERAAVGALAAGVVFALHPIHVESACNIAGRSDILAALFLVAACLAALVYHEKGKPLALAGFGGFCLFAFLSKEVALAGVALVPACLWLGSGGVPWKEVGAEAKKRMLAVCGAAVLSAAVYFLLRVAGRADLEHPPVDMLAGLANIPAAVAYYLRYLFLPVPMQVFVGELPSALETLLVLALGAVAVGACVWTWRKRKESLPLLAALWIFFTAAPSLSIVILALSDTPVAERYLYLPSVGVSLAVAWGAARWRPSRALHKQLALGFCIAVAALCIYADFTRATVWTDDLSLWSEATRNPKSARQGSVWLNLGTAYQARGDLTNAGESYRRALNPGVTYGDEGRALAWNNLGTILVKEANAYAIASQYAQARTLLTEALTYFDKAGSLAPDYPSVILNRGNCQLNISKMTKFLTGRYDLPLLRAAKDSLETALTLVRAGPEVQQTLAQTNELIRQAEAEGK